MKILVTGGCGYIGSHTIVDLLEHGHDVICVDDCCRSSVKVIDYIYTLTGKKIKFYNINLTNSADVRTIFVENTDISGIIHFAAYKAVGESVLNPLLYYKNNLESLVNILSCCEEFNIPNIVFSSSCTVYGQPDSIPVKESSPLKPAESPYGATKQICEQILRDFFKRPSNSQSVCLLRYFNPAGAHPSGLLGELPIGSPQNLVPVIVEAAAGKRELTVFGVDYPTKDGSCVRDYIHVCDIASAHRLALEYIQTHNADVHVFNLGAGAGVTVLEAIHAFESATGIHVSYTISPRRPGDICAIYADNSFSRQTLGWKIQYDLETIMKTAWDFYCKKN